MPTTDELKQEIDVLRNDVDVLQQANQDKDEENKRLKTALKDIPELKRTLEELDGIIGAFNFSDKYVFNKTVELFPGRSLTITDANLILSSVTGTQIGTGTGQKLAFWGATPVDQPATIADPTGAGTAGVDTPARTAIIAILDLLQEVGLMA